MNAILFRLERAMVLGVVLVAAAIAGGCVVHERPVVHAPHGHVSHARVVVVAPGHRHSRHCGHFHHRNRWYYLHGHVHGARCGHVYARGIWIRR